ncbi:MAG: 4Fe-4S dicluster domain-containing protein [Candidatus Lokiarchaeota archaeon]|nr:4Fe-4S dicluster domain-containing protein [Candidatus Lokiarchaeota archaeon]
MKKVISIELNKCTGCGLCEMACSLSHEGECSRNLSRIKVIKLEESGVSMPVLCVHCIEAPCVIVCPTRAINRDPKTAATIVDHDLCIGCRACMTACPFGALSFDNKRDRIVRCDLCDGEPECVKYCEPKAIDFIEIKKEGSIKRRSLIESFSMALKNDLMKSEVGKGSIDKKEKDTKSLAGKVSV